MSSIKSIIGGTGAMYDTVSIGSILYITGTLAGSGASSGALQVTGGGSVNGIFYCGQLIVQGVINNSGGVNSSGVIKTTLTTDSTSTTSGSLILSGGVGIAKSLWVGTTANLAGAVTCGSSLSVGGTSTLTGAVTCSSSLSVATGLTVSAGPVTTQGIIYDSAVTVSGSGPFTADYSQGGVWRIPSVPSANFQLNIINIPTVQGNEYTLTFMYYQASNKYFASTMNVVDTASTYLLGSSGTYVAPLWNGGTPTISTSPCMIIQQVSIISLASVRYVVSTVSQYY